MQHKYRTVIQTAGGGSEGVCGGRRFAIRSAAPQKGWNVTEIIKGGIVTPEASREVGHADNYGAAFAKIETLVNGDMRIAA